MASRTVIPSVDSTRNFFIDEDDYVFASEQQHGRTIDDATNEQVDASVSQNSVPRMEVTDQYSATGEEEDEGTNIYSEKNEIHPNNPHENDEGNDEDDAQQFNGCFERLAKLVARNPRTFFWTALIVAFGTSAFGLIYGEFSIEVTSSGWTTRGTFISDRQSQSILVRSNKKRLFSGGEEEWVDLTENIQPSWENEIEELRAGDRRRRRGLEVLTEGHNQGRPLQLPSKMTDSLFRRLQDSVGSFDTSTIEGMEGCDFSVYTENSFTRQTRLWPVWKSQTEDTSLLSPKALRDICVAEENTQRILEKQGLCFGCDEGCLPPYSMVLLVRLAIPGGFDMSCDALSTAWEPFYPAMELQVQQCVADTKELALNTAEGEIEELPPSCPPYFDTALVDAQVDENKRVTFSSSIFVTTANSETTDKMYEHVDSFDRGSTLVIGAYDTQNDTFRFKFEDESISSDMSLAAVSAIVVIVAIMVHTKSPFITLVGLLQIVFSFPLSYTIYTLVLRLDFFPFLNFIGIFIVFALGADDVFVAIDKWKNARLQHPDASTQAIAAMALPDAAGAMFLTTLTTSVAFFATAICPVAPVKLFAIFCGMLVALDYVMCVVLIFPCLCMYDINLESTRREGRRKNYFISLQGATACKPRDTVYEDTAMEERQQHDEEAAEVDYDNEDNKPNQMEQEERNKPGHNPIFIQRVLVGYYNILHRIRWFLLIICLGALALAAYYSTTMTLPDTLDVRLLDESVQFEQSGLWRQNLLREALGETGVNNFVFWGVTPADTGNHSKS